ncbi:MAG: TetR/AcrR family transcriptional regulator [Actinobacteria bacterium]|nr:TetR/AcrR family transcriptional regulator [Actinomycetota bacterium]NIS28776.1 TetR/AcrR family transcriptional regulator [Actinomycetota bacterium]NIT94154.1 TetR/AcrR family transcriptional regulator [Actinomycetota bacterium]NIU17771.1 TetR/AcrR family transcriptional regulator [Actinomycetota bacterium]NIU64228.1 TetR/AcrR family transcriptional regulator [Actinomycetota bacterium]
MAPRARLSRTGVVEIAVGVVDRHGYDALNLSVVAEALGVGPSALYSHVDGLDGLRRVVAVESVRRLTCDVRDAAIGTAGDDAVRAVATAYRDFVRRHPGRFAATLQSTGGAERADVDRELHSVFVLLHRAGGHDEQAAELAARSSRSALHGFAVLEHADPDGSHDAEFGHLVDLLCRILTPS